MTIKILEHLWVLFIAVGGWMVNQLMGKISDLDKGKASVDDLIHLKKKLYDLDKRVDTLDHSTQLRLVPRNELKSDLILLHDRVNQLSQKVCEKEDRIKTIRVKNEEKED
tara:strand:- start:1165 stop:1494 length:330 start_codon:yes stop_codon:yes gene_type:complete